jgi:hypothetical protein
MPWVTSKRGTSDAQVGQAPVRARLVSLLLRPTAPPLALGVVVAAFLIVAETVLVYLLTQVAPGMAFGVVYLIGVLVVSTGWGFGLAAMTSVASALAFDYFHVRSAGSLIPTGAAVNLRGHHRDRAGSASSAVISLPALRVLPRKNSRPPPTAVAT